MPNKSELALINILADGAFHSGEELGQQLAMSRSGVWKCINRLKDYGLYCQRLQGQGYCLPGGVEFLNQELIDSQLNPHAKTKIQQLDCLLEVDSTNNYLLEKIRSGSSSANVCLAEYQTAGRGRRGRTWLSPFGKNISLSLNWLFDNGAAATEGLTLIVGLAVATVLETYGIKGLGLKWPNDILCQQKKLAGILVEMSMDSLGLCHVVIGIGVNLDISESHKHHVSQDITDLSSLSSNKIDRNELAANILNELIMSLEKFTKEGLKPFISLWQHLDVLKNQPINLYLADKVASGIALGIDETGGLKVQHDGAIHVYRAGEVSVRKELA